MPRYEYKVVPAPAKGRKAKGVKAPEARFALAVETTLNEMGAEGWEYLRAELLPSDERSGLTGSTTQWRNVLVFRRPVAAELDDLQPRLMEAPDPTAAAAPAATPWPEDPQEPPLRAVSAPGDAVEDNGVEDTAESTDPGAALAARAQQARAAEDAEDAEDDAPEAAEDDAPTARG